MNATTKLWFKDKVGNEFPMRPNHVKQGVWSPFEAKNRHDAERDMARLREIAAKRGGKVISKVFVNDTTEMTFEDAAGNQFPMYPYNVKRGHWSPFEAKVVRDPEYHLTELRKGAGPGTETTVRPSSTPAGHRPATTSA